MKLRFSNSEFLCMEEIIHYRQITKEDREEQKYYDVHLMSFLQRKHQSD